MSGASRRDKHLAFAGVLTVLFLSSLNLTVVGTALPRIVAELQGFDLYAWAFTSFSLAATVALPVAGRVSDVVGRRPVLLVGIVIFALAALGAGFSQGMGELVAWRAAQGIGGGVLISMTWAATGDIFSARERGRYQGLTGAVFGLSSVIGPVAGGLITDTLGWRWVFFVNVPVAWLAFEAVRRFLPRSKRTPGTDLDLAGAAWLVIGTVPLLVGLTWAGEEGFAAPRVAMALAVSLFGLAGFVWREFHAPAPILDPRLFRDRTYLFANATTFLTAVGLFCAVMYLPLFIQGVQGGSAAASGFALAPMMLGVVLGSTLSGWLASRSGRYRRWIVAGVALMTVGFALTAGFGPDTPVTWLVAVMVVLGAGIGPTNSLLTLAVQNALPASRLGAATGTNQFFRQIGGTIGVTVLGTLVATRVRAGLGDALPNDASLPAPLLRDLADPNLLTDPIRSAAIAERVTAVLGPDAYPAILAGLRTLLGTALSETFWIATFVTLAALVFSTLLPSRELQDDAPATQTGASPSEASGPAPGTASAAPGSGRT